MPVWAGSTLPVLGGVVDYMRLHGLWRLVTENNSYGEMEGAKIGIGWQGDGLILYRASQKELADYKARGIAVVLLSTEGPDEDFPRILPDNRQAGSMAAEHLQGLGLQSFAFLGRGETLYQEEEFAPGIRIYARERLSGFKETLKESGHEPQVHYLPGFPLWKEDTWRDIENEVANFLMELPSPVGLFAVDDALAAVVLRAAEKINKQVPNELAVIGFGDDLSYCHASLPALSSISYPGREAGFQAAKQIDQQLHRQPVSQKNPRIPANTLLLRESTDFIAIDDEETVNLIRWIRLHAPRKSVQVSDLENQSEYSLSSIKSRFRKYLGHSPKEEIKKVRLQHLSYLLRNPTLSLSEISHAMQFSSTHEMSRFFLREAGERPTVYRDRCRQER